MAGKSIEFHVTIQPRKRRPLPDTHKGRLQALVEAAKAHIRAKVQHPFLVIKQQFGYQKTSLLVLAEIHCMMDILAALSNRLLARRQLLLAS